MGRHRSDPRGLARILIAAIAVVLALALVIVGGMSLVRGLTSETDPDPSRTSASPSASSDSAKANGTSTRRGTASSSSSIPLVVRVVGSATNVTVTVAGTGEVLQQGTLNPGEALQFSKVPFFVTVSDAASVEVRIYGQLQARGQSGERKQWFVPRRQA